MCSCYVRDRRTATCSRQPLHPHHRRAVPRDRRLAHQRPNGAPHHAALEQAAPHRHPLREPQKSFAASALLRTLINNLGCLGGWLLVASLEHGGGYFWAPRPLAASLPGVGRVSFQRLGIGLHRITSLQEKQSCFVGRHLRNKGFGFIKNLPQTSHRRSGINGGTARCLPALPGQNGIHGRLAPDPLQVIAVRLQHCTVLFRRPCNPFLTVVKNVDVARIARRVYVERGASGNIASGSRCAASRRKMSD